MPSNTSSTWSKDDKPTISRRGDTSLSLSFNKQEASRTFTKSPEPESDPLNRWTSDAGYPPYPATSSFGSSVKERNIDLYLSSAHKDEPKASSSSSGVPSYDSDSTKYPSSGTTSSGYGTSSSSSEYRAGSDSSSGYGSMYSSSSDKKSGGGGSY